MPEVDGHLVQHPQDDAGRHKTLRKNFERRRDGFLGEVRLEDVAKRRQDVFVDDVVCRRRRQDPLAREAAQGPDRLEEVASGRYPDLEVAGIRWLVPGKETD